MNFFRPVTGAQSFFRPHGEGEFFPSKLPTPWKCNGVSLISNCAMLQNNGKEDMLILETVLLSAIYV